MLVDIHGKQMEVTPALKSYTLDKVSVLNKYLDGHIRAHFTLSVSKKFRQRVDVSVSINGAHFKGSDESEDMYASIDNVMDKIARQARKFKEKRKSHHPARKSDEHVPIEEDETALQEVIRENMDTAEQMSDEEAIENLRRSNTHFMVYRVKGSDGMRVAYFRKDGNIGILEY